MFRATLADMSETVKLTPEVKETLSCHLENRAEIRFAILYGSAAEGMPFRDLDVGLFVDRTAVPAFKELDYSFTLSDELEQVVSYPVDARVINDVPLGFRYNVSRGLPLVINDEATFFHFLERTWNEYLDFQPLAMQYLRELR
jgi:predicted nucleotidyltransferase